MWWRMNGSPLSTMVKKWIGSVFVSLSSLKPTALELFFLVAVAIKLLPSCVMLTFSKPVSVSADCIVLGVHP